MAENIHPTPLIIHVPSSDFPSDVLKWMKKDAKGKILYKLMKSNKYFQHSEFPFFAVKFVEYDAWWDNKWIIYTLDGHRLEGLGDTEEVLWITETLRLTELPNLVSRIISATAVFDLKELLFEHQELMFDEFKILTASGNIKCLSFQGTNVKHENGDPVFIDELFEFLSNVQDIWIANFGTILFSSNFVNTCKKYNFSQLKSFNLINLTFYDDFQKFTKFMNQNPHVYYQIYFDDDALSEEEKFAVGKYVQGIIDVGLTEFRTPTIQFFGQTHDQHEALCSLRSQYDDKQT
uniref:DUF38 domain-containing protein n=1 Tax=Panagrolaimus sp. ES5 TaxID=591445 RepID=A0AC34GZ39_9BILA